MTKPDKKDQIIGAAEKLFAGVGYDSTSVRDICAEANVNVAMINYYFGSKEGLLKEMIERKSILMRGRMEALLQDKALTSHEKLRIAVEHMLERMFNHRPFTLSVIREMTKINQPEMRKMILGLFLPNMKLMREIIKTGIRKKEFRKVDVELMICTISGTAWYVISSGDLIIPGLEETEAVEDLYKQRLLKHLYQLIHNQLVIE